MIYYIGQESLVKSDLWQSCSLDYMFEYFKDHKWINLDTETQGKDCHTKKIILIQFGDFENQFVIDVRFINIQKLKTFLENNNFIFHNAKFDYKFLKASNIIIENIYDTMLAECVLYCGYEKYGYGLAILLKRYLNIDLDKETREDFFLLEDKPLTDKQIEYAALDVKYLHLLKEQQEIKLKEYNLEYCLSIENNVVKALADIEYNGIYLNKDKWLDTAIRADLQLLEIQRDLDLIIQQDNLLSQEYKPTGILNLFNYEERIYNINYSSPLQMKKLISILGYNIESTNDRELKKLTKEHKFFEKLQEYRKTAKIVSTYGEKFLKYINKTTGRVHTSFWQVLNTGRVSSGSKDDNAPNMQNIPGDNKFRNAFEARSGFLWISADYSGQELRLMADASNEKGFIDILNSGEDLHCYAGSMMFKKPITKQDKDLRNKAKTINFGKPYGMGPNKLADTLNISIDEANQLFIEYEKAFPSLNQWLKQQGLKAKQQMFSTTFSPSLRRRWYPKIKEAQELRKQIKENKIENSKVNWRTILMSEGETERNGGNQPIQGTGADICKEALIEIRKLIQEYNLKYNKEVAFLICTVHDAIDVEVREDLAQQFAQEMKEIMIKCGNKYVNKVNMEVDITIDKYWKK